MLDLTRVIAGPVATRLLGALGADVLRLDPPGRPDLLAGSPADTLVGKRSAFVDMATPAGLEHLHRLLDRADVVVCGYRPGSLDRFGLGPEDLAERHPGLVSIYLAAWGHTGPWSGRRGFDSIVQAACGIASIESSEDGQPGALPCQLLDHGTGYLTAAAALDGLRRQRDVGGTHLRRLSLARTAAWLLSARSDPSPHAATTASGADEARRWMTTLTSTQGPLDVVTPPGRLGGDALAWPDVCSCYGADPPQWQSEDST